MPMVRGGAVILLKKAKPLDRTLWSPRLRFIAAHV